MARFSVRYGAVIVTKATLVAVCVLFCANVPGVEVYVAKPAVFFSFPCFLRKWFLVLCPTPVFPIIPKHSCLSYLSSSVLLPSPRFFSLLPCLSSPCVRFTQCVFVSLSFRLSVILSLSLSLPLPLSVSFCLCHSVCCHSVCCHSVCCHSVLSVVILSLSVSFCLCHSVCVILSVSFCLLSFCPVCAILSLSVVILSLPLSFSHSLTLSFSLCLCLSLSLPVSLCVPLCAPRLLRQHAKLNRSLLTFNPEWTTGPFLTSPRSLEACLRHGVEPADLCVKPRDAFLRGSDGFPLDDDFVDERHARYEQRRLRECRLLRVGPRFVRGVTLVLSFPQRNWHK